MESLGEHLSDLEVSKKMEDEHLRLQREVRMIQIDRMHRTMGIHPQFRRQDHLLRTLKKEYVNLIKDLKIAKSGANKKKDKRMKKNLKNSILQRLKLELECEGGLTVMEQLDGILQKNTIDNLELRRVVRSAAGRLEERRILSENRLVSTENKLEVAMHRFNAVQGENKKIREEIEHMLKDRAIANKAWSKMIKALHMGKKFLTDLFESSTLAYDQRDEWCAKLRSVQEKGKMDQMVQIHEMRDLQRAFDHEMKLYYFLAKKGVARINTKQEEKEEQERIKEEERIFKEIDVHLRIIEEINDYTEEPKVEKIIDAFEKREQTNFSTYQLLTDYCAENIVLTRDVRRIRQQIEDYKDLHESAQSRRREKIERLKQTLQKQRERTEKLRNENEKKDNLIKDTMEGVEEMFKMLDCSLEPFQNLLGDKHPTTNHLGLTFQLITEKIKDLVEIAYYYERQMPRKKDHLSSSRLKKYMIHHDETIGQFTPKPITQIVLSDPCPSCVEARWLCRVSDALEAPFDKVMTLKALVELSEDPSFVRSDRVHPLTECRTPQSRIILARRYMQN